MSSQYFREKHLTQFRSMSGLINLEYLKINYVKFSSADPFRGLNNIRKLVLIGCRFNQSENDMFKLSNWSNLKCLEIHSPRFSSCQLGYQYLPQLESLVLSHVNNDSFECFSQLSTRLKESRLEFLYLDDEKSAFSALRHNYLSILDLSKNDLTTFDGEWILGLTNLEHLNLSSNLIRTIHLRYEFFSCLKSLRLDKNQLECVEMAFSHLKNVKILDLSHNNNLRLTSPDVFKGLDNLEQLYLIDVSSIHDLQNQIEGRLHICLDLFSCLPKLTILGLKQNELTTFKFLDLLPLNLSKLCLSQNLLRQIDQTSFGQLVNLTFLDLSCNQLGNLPDGAFVALKSLKILNLFSNNIESIDEKAFEGLDSLSKLCLRSNPIKTVSFDSFILLKSLDEVDLHDVRILASHLEKLNAYYSNMNSRVKLIF